MSARGGRGGGGGGEEEARGESSLGRTRFLRVEAAVALAPTTSTWASSRACWPDFAQRRSCLSKRAVWASGRSAEGCATGGSGTESWTGGWRRSSAMLVLVRGSRVRGMRSGGGARDGRQALAPSRSSASSSSAVDPLQLLRHHPQPTLHHRSRPSSTPDSPSSSSPLLIAESRLSSPSAPAARLLAR